MDIFYKNKVSAGMLQVVSLPPIQGQANLFVFNKPAPTGRQGTFVPGALITKVSYKQMTSTQFQQSLENVIYVYSFGDQMGDLVISGLAFPRLCDSPNTNGIQEIFNFYRTNRVSAEVAAVRVTFASEVIRGFLVSMSMQTMDASAGIHSYTLLLKTMPFGFRGRVSGRDDVALSGGTGGGSTDSGSSGSNGVRSGLVLPPDTENF